MITFYWGRIVKKNILITTLIFTLLLTTKAFCEINAQNFIRHFSSCTKFMINGDNRIYVMLGWSNRECYYKEFSTKEKVTCNFKILELQDITKIMKQNNFNPDKGLTSLKAANKYLEDPNVCTIIAK